MLHVIKQKYSNINRKQFFGVDSKEHSDIGHKVQSRAAAARKRVIETRKKFEDEMKMETNGNTRQN